MLQADQGSRGTFGASGGIHYGCGHTVGIFKHLHLQPALQTAKGLHPQPVQETEFGHQKKTAAIKKGSRKGALNSCTLFGFSYKSNMGGNSVIAVGIILKLNLFKSGLCLGLGIGSCISYEA